MKKYYTSLTANHHKPKKIAGLVALVLALEPGRGISHTIISSPIAVSVGHSMAGAMAGQTGYHGNLNDGQASSDEYPVTGLGSQGSSGRNPFVMPPRHKHDPYSIASRFYDNFLSQYLIPLSLNPYVNTLCATGKKIYEEIILLYEKKNEKELEQKIHHGLTP